MSAGLQQLDFMVSLIDKVSGPAGKMMTTMDTVITNIQSGYKKIGYGAAGLVGTGMALDRLIAPTKELNRALGEVESLGVVDEVLDKVTKSALDFTSAYGGSAAEFVSSSYDIQSAIAGLAGNELAQFTNASAVLAKGTKSDTGTITSYMGTMYGIFKTNADAVGKGAWVEQLAGQTALAVQMFKTTGSEMAASFGNVGAEGQAMGVSMNEQLAVLGTLQATMSGTEAGTKYKSFLAGVGKAQDALGLTFTDSQGKMLPMVDILDKIKGKFGQIDTVAESDLLQKAFGRKEAAGLIKLLIKDTDGLASSINAIGEQKGMAQALKMADAIKDPFEVATGKVANLQIKLGQALMPTLTSLLGVFGTVADKMSAWTEQYPTLTNYIGYAVIVITGVIAILSLLSIGMGIGTMMSGGFSIAMLAFNAAMAVAKLSVFSIIPAIWGFTTALLANPMTWVVIGVVALGAALVGLVVYWDDITAAIGRFFDKISSLSGIKDLLTGLIPDFILNLMADDEGVKPTGTKMPESIGTAAQTPNAQAGGGVINRISNASSTNNSRSIGGVTVNNYGQAMNGQQLADEMAFLAG